MKLPFADRWIRALVLVTAVVCFMFLPRVGQGKEIQVELVWKFKDAGWLQVTAEQGSFLVFGLKENLDQGMFFNKGARLEMAWGGWSPILKQDYGGYRSWYGKEIVWKALDENCTFRIRTPEGTSVVYRGNLKVSWDKTHWKLINTLNLEDYLQGVVPIEMSNSWADDGLEALKAQAVAARTYAVKKTEATPLITDSPDKDQAYLGKNVEGAAGPAVTATRGEILVDSQTSRPIDALYSSHNGGYSELAENVWNQSDSHFPSQTDPFSDGIGGAVNRWRFIIGADYLGKAFGLAPITGISLEKLPSGRVKKVLLTDAVGEQKSLSGREFCKAFYPYGQPVESFAFLGNLFDVQDIRTAQKQFPSRVPFTYLKPTRTDSPQRAATGPRLVRIRSSLQGIREHSSPYGTFIFWGRGWGHGVGMSQWGAYQMAQRQYSYQEILEFYYKQVKLLKTY